MKRFTQILRKIFFLPPLPTLLAALFGYGFLLAAGIFEIEIPVLQYLAYFSSAYALIITITGFPHFTAFVRSAKQRVSESAPMRKVCGTSLGKRFFGDVRSRTELMLYIGLFINFLYIGIKLFSGIYYRSVWFISLAAYYAILAVMRFILLHKGRNSSAMTPKNELKRYRLCGIMLLLLSQALAGLVIFMVRQNSGFRYPGLLIYAMALYSFYSVITAVVNLVKFRRNGSPILSAAKAINFVTALVSILSLETAMIDQFGSDGDLLFRKYMTASSGIAVCVTVVSMAVFMLCKSPEKFKSPTEHADRETENIQQENS